MAVGGTQPTLRKYLGALKDTTTVSLAKVNSDYKDLDIAIVKATNHVERPSKEKYIRAWDYSAWRTRDLDTVALLDHLPPLQQLLFRLLACQPQGASSYNVIIQHALSMVSTNTRFLSFSCVMIVALESVKIYTAISDGTINLVDKPPASFLQTMEEYVRDAPTMAKEKAVLAIEYKKEPEEEEKPASPPPAPEPEPEQQPEPEPEPVIEEPPAAEPDFLGLNEPSPAATAIEEQNALALAIVPIDDVPKAAPTFENGVTGWELALVTAPSSNETAVTSTKKLAGGLDLLTLDSLYDDANRRASQPAASYNPWDATPAAPMLQTMAPAMQDPFYASGGYAAPHAVQMAAMAQQQQAFMLQQQMMTMAAAAAPVAHPMQMQQNPANPFGNPFAAAGAHPYGGAGVPLHAGPGNAYTGLI
ncbi:hypothetical protein HU200_035575 [Digitaria exilis]|uniref:AP180 N-terminal homology (ANTH) domain-containing protein n=1 Tax=Digitaria exilis TaxID=1010633 RepID=A0A835BIR5_9POAL|nr:hypothetical protein HU200_035575 [Digitaria exilis]